jgi:NAD(P)-dependent dehydrogenase (short-subunit alcohol dehydrogenase family)
VPGWPQNRRPADISVADWRRVVGINLDSLFLLTQTFLPPTRQRGWGAHHRRGERHVPDGRAGRGAHHLASKGGVIGFIRAVQMRAGSVMSRGGDS